MNNDIRAWLKVKLRADVVDLEEEAKRGRAGKAAETRVRKIATKRRRLERLDDIKRFIYSPTGENRTRDALHHAEVLQISAAFLQNKPAMRSILVGRHPIVLIDESQDTNKDLIDALFGVQAANPAKFVLGLIGDMMQRIYLDGKEGLGSALPPDWAQPRKLLNHRCPQRVVALLNKVRDPVDQKQQRPAAGALPGLVRVFVLPSETADKPAAERQVAEHMAGRTSDVLWNSSNDVKTLTLEHRMAAERMHILDMFVPLYDVDSWRTSILAGDLPAPRFFTDQVLPLVRAVQNGDQFELARTVKSQSPLLSREALKADDKKQLAQARAAIEELMELWKGGADPSLHDVLLCVSRNGLFEVPDVLEPHALPDAPTNDTDDASSERERERFEAIEKFLKAPFSQVSRFASYVAGEAHFGTHQGVKGLEFDRVMVIMDDESAKGFNFKYEKLFGGKESTEKSVQATRRLFYVTCSRAKKSLALVAYSREPLRIKRFLVDEGWFNDEEIVLQLPGGTDPIAGTDEAKPAAPKPPVPQSAP